MLTSNGGPNATLICYLMRMITSQAEMFQRQVKKKKHPDNYNPISFTSVLSEIIKTTLEVAEKHLKNNVVNCDIDNTCLEG